MTVESRQETKWQQTTDILVSNCWSHWQTNRSCRGRIQRCRQDRQAVALSINAKCHSYSRTQDTSVGQEANNQLR